MEYTLYTKAIDGGPFNCRPAMEYKLDASKILCNESPILPGDKHPYNMRLWLIGHEFGAICAVWATCEQDAIDEAVNYNMMDCMQVSEEDYIAMSEEEHSELLYAGNASEPFYQDYLWIAPVEFDKTRDFGLLIKFARCEDNDTLDY